MIRLFVAAGLALAISMVLTAALIDILTRRSIGQPIHEDVPDGHTTKVGTPTMGGIAVVVGAVLSYFISAAYRGIYTVRGGLVMAAIAGAGLVGFLDDYIKVRDERNLGLNKRSKMAGLLTVAVLFAVLMATVTKVPTVLSFTRWTDPIIELGRVIWVVWAVLLIIGAANAVNLTDGLDGLAAGAGIFAYSAFVIIGFWGFRNADVYQLQQGLDLATVASSMVGALTGFLWFNANPARIFMGDTGSLAIGTGLAALALTTGTQLLLPIIGALFVVETLSVIIQVVSFRTTGRRVFRMAPIHHHFELKGWPEATVTIRFWMMSGIATAAGIGLYYYDFLRFTHSLAGVTP